MAKKQAPLKDESIYSVDDIFSKLDEILDAVKNKNIQKAPLSFNTITLKTRTCCNCALSYTPSVRHHRSS